MFPFGLPRNFVPKAHDNRLAHVGEVGLARENFLKNKPNNLHFLLRSRFEWMNSVVKDAKDIIEIGSGAGFSKLFIKNPNFKMTDILPSPWVDKIADALNLPYEDNSLDVIVASHMIHHLAYPTHFFNHVSKKLKPGGALVISEIETSFMMRLMLFILKHEGWSYDINPFDSSKPSNDPADPWSANCAIPEMLFKDSKVFEAHFPQFAVEKNELVECFALPISGGVIAKSKTLQLPWFILNAVGLLDRFLVATFPSIFALGRRVVLRKKLDPAASKSQRVA